MASVTKNARYLSNLVRKARDVAAKGYMETTNTIIDAVVEKAEDKARDMKTSLEFSVVKCVAIHTVHVSSSPNGKPVFDVPAGQWTKVVARLRSKLESTLSFDVSVFHSYECATFNINWEKDSADQQSQEVHTPVYDSVVPAKRPCIHDPVHNPAFLLES